MVAYDFGVGQFFSGAMGQLYPGGDMGAGHPLLNASQTLVITSHFDIFRTASLSQLTHLTSVANIIFFHTFSQNPLFILPP